jgi:hypothetical protein
MTWGLALGTGLLLSGCALPELTLLAPKPVIVMVHGNGDSAALWQTTLWRFESNGWPKERLHAINVPYPLARDADNTAQAGRSSTAEHMAFLQAEVEKVLHRTGARQVVLMGNSRGGNAIRNYVCNGGGQATVSHAILGGTPNHGVQAVRGLNEANEFSGTGPFLTQLNAPKNAQGDEVCGPTRWMTIRSDNNDKFAQPDGLWLGMKGKPTGVSYAGPELKGAINVVLPRIDHRETSFSKAAFEESYRFITGRAPASSAIVSQAPVRLNGQVVGLGVDPLTPGSGNFVNNLPLVGARLDIYQVDPLKGTRLGAAAHSKAVGADGVWGPFKAQSNAAYEFVIQAPGYATTHIYRSPFPRSSDIVHLRPERIAEADRDAKSVLTFVRPRGYFDPTRDAMSLDGQARLPGVPDGAGVAVAKLKLSEAGQRAVTAEFNGERVIGYTWPLAENHTTVLELTY